MSRKPQSPEYWKAYYAKHKEAIKARVRAYERANRDKVNEYRKLWRRRHGQAIYRKYQLKYKYGLSLDGFKALFDSQRGECAICLSPLPANAAVDHDHATGAVRALLCRTCNIAIGLINDNPDVLRRAAEYLDSHRAKRGVA